jgi:FkbM family methyltransferase
MKLDEVTAYAQNLGVLGFAVYSARRVVDSSAFARSPYKLYSRHTQFPLWCRPGTSDLTMFAEIICHRAFRCFDGVQDARLIIDCGANVGYSSAYFLSRYREATVIAIEPDEENFRVLERNLTPYQPRCRAICSAVWSQQIGLLLSPATLGKGNECAREVRPVRGDEVAQMRALDIGSVLDDSGFERISILKVDIEGAERIVFDANYERWLPRVDNLIIELHDAECERVFHNAIAHETFEISTCDFQTVCMRTDLTVGTKNKGIHSPVH